MELIGAKDLEQKLRELGAVAAVPILRNAVRYAMAPALERARQTVHVGKGLHRTFKGRLVAPGFAKRSIRIVTAASKDRRTVSAILGVRKEAFYAVTFIERELGSGKEKFHPWLRPALRSTQDIAVTRFGARLKERIDRVTSRGVK